MFKAIGMPRLFAETRAAFDARWSRPESSSFVEDKLDEIVRTRHVVAHTAVALQISRSDLSSWSSFLETFADVLDERLDTYAENVLTHVRPV
jgi:RiboL-PSP-HEPN